MDPDPKELGHLGEDRAADYLIESGYTIIERNWHWPNGELDIVAEYDGEIVFVEVKARRSHAYGAPEAAITYSKRSKLVQTANAYLIENDQAETPWRIDVVAIDMERDGSVRHLEHFENAIGE